MTTAIEHLLPLLHHPQGMVVHGDDLDRQAILQTGGELLDVHLDGAITGDTGHDGIRVSKLHTHGGRQTEAHGAEAP